MIRKSKLTMFLTFFKLGAFTFGGGYAMMFLIEKEIVHNKKWMTIDELYEIISLSQVLPGPIAVNTSLYVGNKLFKRRGAFLALFGVVLPSFLIILSIAMFLARYFDNPILQRGFLGVRAGVLAMILFSLKNMMKNALKDNISKIIFLIALGIVLLKVSPILLIIVGGTSGVLLGKFFPNFVEKKVGDKK